MLQIHTCLDEAQAVPAGGAWLRGWWLCSRPVRRLIAVDTGGTSHPVWYGDPRPDVATAFPDLPESKTCGYQFAIDRRDAIATGQWWFETTDGAWYVLPADWTRTTPQSLNDATPAPDPLPAPVAAAAARCGDPEERLQLAFRQGAGLTLRLDIINKCNLRCIMCHYSVAEVYQRPTKLITPEQFATMFESIAPFVGEVILSCADEPLVSKFFPEILTYLRRVKSGLVIKFCTNATLMTAPLRRLLVEQQVDQILFSLDGVRKRTLETIRVGVHFERVLGNILAFRELRDRSGTTRPDIVLDFVMMVRNLHEAPAFVAMARRLGASAIDFRHVVAGFDTFALFHEQLANQPARFNHYRERILAEGRRLGIDVYIPPPLATTETWTPAADEPSADLSDFEQAASAASFDVLAEPLRCVPIPPAAAVESLQTTFAGTYCARPFSEITLRNQDEVMPCPWHAKSLGRLSKTGRLSDIFFGAAYRELRRNMLRPEGDPDCAFCPLKARTLPTERHGHRNI